MISDILDIALDVALCASFVVYAVKSNRLIKTLQSQNTILIHSYGLLSSMYKIVSDDVVNDGVKNDKSEKAGT